MKRTAGALILLAALGGCVSTGAGPGAGGSCGGCGGWAGGPPTVPGVQGPWGQPVAMAAPYTATPPNGEAAAKQMLALSVPLDIVQASASGGPMMPSGLMLAGGQGAVPPPPGSIAAPGMPHQPFVAGVPQPGNYPPGAVAAVGAITSPQANRFTSKRTEVSFTAPYGMKVSWYAPSQDGRTSAASNHIDTPGRYNFVQGAIYRLKLSDIPLRTGVELYPTLEVVPSNLKTDSFLAHSAVPVSFTNEDLDQVAAGNYLVKVIYLPDPQYQDLATAGPEEVVSSRLEPGVDPVAEAYRRGSILLVVRLGNIDLELANSPAMDAPNPYQARPMGPAMPGHGMMPGMPMPSHQAGMPGMQMPAMQLPGHQGGMPGMSMPGMPQGRMPGMQQMMPTMQPGQGGLPGLPTIGQPSTDPNQSSKLPDPSTLQQASYKSAASSASDGSPTDNKPDKKPASRKWWSGGGDSDKK